MSTAPLLTPVTSPALFTVATLVFEDAHVADDVTVCVVLFEKLAVAANWDVDPTFGAVPLTATPFTVGVVLVGAVVDEGDDDPLPHAQAATAMAVATVDATTIRRIRLPPPRTHSYF